MDPTTKIPLFSPLVIALARHIVGPRTEPPPHSPFSLAELQDIKWRRIATESERADALNTAAALVAGPLAGLLRPGAENLIPTDAEPLASTGLPDQPYSPEPTSGGDG